MKHFPFRHALFAAIAIFLASCAVPVPPVELVDALDASAWDSSCWISVADAPVCNDTIQDDSRAMDGASWFVATLQNEKKISSARWMTTGLGVYEIYINGQAVGQEFLKPGFTHFEKTRRSFTYDVTALLNTAKEAENQFAAQVTPGWWADKIISPAGKVGFNGKKCAFRAVLEVTYSDGTTRLFGTDTTHWKAGIAGPVRHADIYDGEVYDARILPGFATPEKLTTPERNEEFKGEILPTQGAEVYLRQDLALSPVRAYIWKDIENDDDDNYGKVITDREYTPTDTMLIHPGEHLVIDFGQNCSAVPSFDFQAAEGTTLTCLVGELLNDGNGAQTRGMDGPEGSVHRLNLRIPHAGMMVEYTFGEREKAVTYQPRFTFMGYRYVSIHVTGGDVQLNSIRSVPVTSIAKEMETGKITTGDENINRLISNTYWGQLSNYLSVPTDCPQRNERLGWTADTQVFTETGSFFAHTRAFFHKWLRDLRDTQSERGGYPSVAPYGQYGSEPTDMYRVGWADAGIIVPWTIYKQYADTTLVAECWTSMEKFMDHMAETRYDHQALIEENGGYQFADWLSYEALESCSGQCFDSNGRLKPETLTYWNYLNASYWLQDARMMADMAKAVGKDHHKYTKMAQDAKNYILEQFFTEEGLFSTPILNTMQTPALFALKNGILDGDAKARMISRLKENFQEHGNCLQTGFLGTSILMPTLTENGMSDLAYELLFQHKNPSWLYSIDNGATTIWERWNSYMKDKGMGPQGMNSFNHYAYGVVCQWIWETVAGIQADVNTPGFRHILMKPVPDKRLGHVEASYESAAGLIRSSWKYEGDRWIWTFTIPVGATATVTLPGETTSTEYQAGTYTVEK